MLVLFIACAVKLQVGAVKSGIARLTGELLALGKPDAIGRRQDPIETDLLGVGDGVEEMRRERRLAAGEQNDDLPAWFERNGAIQHRLYLLQIGFMDIADLIGIRETGSCTSCCSGWSDQPSKPSLAHT